MLLVAGCGAHPLVPKVASTDYVPWLPVPRTYNFPQAPVPTSGPPIPIPAGARACQAGQLEGLYLGKFGAMGNTDTPVVLRNKDAAACWVRGYPDLTILDGANHVLAQSIGAAGRGTYFGNDAPDVQILMLPGTTPFPATAAPGQQMERGQAYVSIEWYDCQAPQAAKLSVDLSNSGGSLLIAYPVAGPYSAVCDGSTAPRSGLLRDALRPGGMEWPPGPDYQKVDLAITAPASAKRGSTLVYFVTFTNSSSRDYLLDQCPDYGEYLGPKLAVAGYRLNCAPVGHIAPGSATKFEMHLGIPPDFAPGSSQLTWVIYDGRLGTPLAHTTIDVT
jgi:hypothetical protein